MRIRIAVTAAPITAGSSPSPSDCRSPCGQTCTTCSATCCVPATCSTIAVAALRRAVGAIIEGRSALLVLDSALLILVEGALQLIFVVTFVRTHRNWFTGAASTAPISRHGSRLKARPLLTVPVRGARHD
ncbi:hypothetical protein GCM10009530_40140 [Microbispora corallina]|uniref:Uncharacterized protein n=1 Tax=Microbispora corallina TaxID=83302 RepID=A0ABQ4GBL3_9ACTN|nr:hypothetical protein [Microbispora corallina]GIH44373.1 hypothetical protein Mco01_73730 [Microbispora corallina]